MKGQPAIIVLAAEQGDRFRRRHMPPGAARHAPGGPGLLGPTLDHALATRLPVVVVTTARLADTVRGHVASRDIVVVPAHARPGAPVDPAETDVRADWTVGHSIAAGVSATSSAAGWLLLPGDMPMVSPATLLAVGQALDQHSISYAHYGGRRGHPVGFAAELYSELVLLCDDDGARRLVARYPAMAIDADADDPGVLIEVDPVAGISPVRATHMVAAAAAIRNMN